MLNYYYYSNYQLLLTFQMCLGLYIQYSKLRNIGTFQQKIDKFSIVVLQPLVITLTGFPFYEF